MKSQEGFSLMEVMVAGVVTSTGLAGIAGLLLTSVALTSDVQEQTQAALQAGQLAAVMVMSPSAARFFLEAPAAVAPDCSGAMACSPAEFAANNLKYWQSGLHSALPGGRGLVCLDSTPQDGQPLAPACDGSGPVTIKVFWTDPAAEPQATHRFSMTVPR